MYPKQVKALSVDIIIGTNTHIKHHIIIATLFIVASTEKIVNIIFTKRTGRYLSFCNSCCIFLFLTHIIIAKHFFVNQLHIIKQKYARIILTYLKLII